MSVDEEHTLDLIRRDLKLMKRVCERFEGRVLKTTGDGLLMCFSSAVKAVECAIAIQQSLNESASKLAPNDSLIHRIGIHLADMYITDADVMGNGVNIAARLQTEADPGGICISQTVYDVAKHGLQLITEYLGPRELKNIREVVPAYKVLLEPVCALDDPYTAVARKLEQSQHLARIRKLLFYVCKNRWEGDSSKLAAENIRGQIQEFLGLASSFEQLKGLLNTAVNTLSKRTEYTLVADEILREIAKFHRPYQQHFSTESDPRSLPQPEEFPGSGSPVPIARELLPVFAQVAHTLDEDIYSFRIKKLLFYICKRQWEGDAARLNQVNTAELLREMYGLAPEAQQLRKLVDRFVQTLNKQAEYFLVADALISKLDRIYPDLRSAGSPLQNRPNDKTRPGDNASVDGQGSLSVAEKALRCGAIAQELEANPNHIRIKKLLIYVCNNQWLSDSSQLATFNLVPLVEQLCQLAPTMERLQTALDGVVKTLSKQAEYALVAGEIVQKMQRLYLPTAIDQSSPVSDSTNPPPAKALAAPAKDPVRSEQSTNAPAASPSPKKQTASFSLLDVRLGILKYTNPLRAKILIFSSLYEDFTFDAQSWFNLKQYELDRLLQELLNTCKSYTDLEHLLYSTAKRLPDSNELVQTADTVIKCLRTFYIHGNPVLVADQQSERNPMTLDEFEESTQGLTKLEEEYDPVHPLPPPLSPMSWDRESAPHSNHTHFLPKTEPRSG